MLDQTLLAAQSGHDQLRRLFWLRNAAIAAQAAALALAYLFLDATLAWLPMAGAVAALAMLNFYTLFRLRHERPVAPAELFLQLAADVAGLTALLYFSGGSSNPFVSLYLLPLVIAAATLPRRYTWAMAAMTLSCYSLLMVWHVPLRGAPDHPASHLAHTQPSGDFCQTGTAPLQMSDAFNSHVLGMWLGFVFSAIVVAYFVAGMARAVRQRDAQLTRAREETLRNERIVALGTQAASAAHELGTPLSTLAVLVGEMRHDAQARQEDCGDLDILDGQVRQCRRILDTLLSHAQEMPEAQTIDDFLRGVLNEWQLLRPTAHYHYLSESESGAPRFLIDTSLRAALLNLLNNAADASPEPVDIRSRHDGLRWRLELHDRGPGLSAEQAARAGSVFFTTKREGRGIGLFLANATIERIGGSVRLFNRPNGGATTAIELPLKAAP